MKHIFRLLQAVGLAAILLCLVHVPVFAQETDEANQFPKGVIEVPEGTTIEIDEEAGTVTIQNCPVEIESGDTFIVYLQDLPIGYVADEVSEQNDSVVISAQKAEKEVYELLDEEGDIALTPDMYEFVPAPNVTCSQSAESPISTQSLDYKDGTLSMNVGLGGASATVSVSNLHLYHSVSDGNIGVTLSGNWEIETTMSVSDDTLADILLGEIRIAGVGKIGLNLSFEQSASVKCHLAGSFSTGVTIDQDGSGTASKGFNITNRSIEGKGEISASLKFTAGVDILVTSADLYAEVGAKTQYTAKTTYYKEPPRSVHCDDFKYYLFANVGVEAQYYSLLSGGMKPLASKKLLGTDAKDTPYITHVHYEDGQRADNCTQGMEVEDLFFGGFDASFSGTVLTDKRDRIIETNFDLPWDMTVAQDLYLSHGTLNLKGRTLTVKGDLIQSSGTLDVENGTLNICGDYRIQSVNDGKYGDSTGNLDVSSGTINIGGDFVVQTNSLLNDIGGGTINLDGNLYQKNAVGNKANFNSASYLNLVLTAGKSHIINFEESEKNSIGHLTLENNVIIQNNIHMGILDSNGHDMTVKGNMISGGDVDLDGGTLLINGTMNHYRGTIRLNGGKLNITGNYLCIGADSNFTPGKENITWSDAELKMTYAADEMRVGGDFLMNSRHANQDLTAGTLYIGGNFTQLNSYGEGAGYNFGPGEKHKTVLNGTGKQKISFESDLSNFGTLETTNDQLVFEKRVSWIKQGSDIHAVSNGCEMDGRKDMDLNGYRLTMDGDISVYSNIDVNNGTLKVNGSLNHYRGTINLNGGKLDITGNYLCVGDDSSFTPGKENITWSDAELKMTYTADEMRVGGDFLMNSRHANQDLTAGTLYVGGDFTQLNGDSYNFSPKETHKTVLNGAGKQTISFASSSCHFGTLELTKPNSWYTFNPDQCWLNLIECAGPTQIASGYSGDLTWNLNDWGVLTFRGNGVMKNYTSKTAMPWYKYADQITSVVIESGVTRIGDYAFYGIPMTSIEIPDTVTAIGDYAFKSAAALKEVALPNKLTKLGESTFYGCTSLENIDIPASLYTVKPYTFKNCTALSSVTFHEGNLMKLSDGAFYGTALTEVTFPACLNIIDSYCFKNCDKLVSIVIPEGKLTEIREAVFYGTAASEITIPEGIKKVGAYAFKNCINLTTINLPDSLTSVGEASFYACNGLQNITIPDHVTSIGNYAFRKCTGLTEAVFGNELTEIGESAFYGCSGLTNLNLNNVTALGGYAFKSCTGLTSVDLGKVETIGESAFHSCIGLENITFPASVTSIGDYCFSGSTKLSQIQFEGDAPKIGVNAFRGLTAKAVYPADNESWTSEVMQNYGGNITWTALEIETSDADTEETVSEAPIEDTDTEKDNSDPENPAVEVPDAEPTEGTCGEGLNWKQNGNELTISGNGKLDNCIWGNGSEIQRVVIEQDVTFVGDHAFDGLDALTEIIFKGNAPVISINAFAARDLTVKYPCGVTSWTSDIFQNYGGNVIWCEVDENGSLVEQQDDGDTVSEKAVSEQSIFEENVTEETISESVEATE